MTAIRLKLKREKSVQRHHPWIFSGAIAACDGTPEPGETVDVLSANGEWLAAGAFSPESQIAVYWDNHDRFPKIWQEQHRDRH